MTFHPQEGEVEAVVPVPFTYPANPEAVEVQEIVIGGVKVSSPVDHYRSHRVWGATARIVADLVRCLSGGAVVMGA